MSTEHYVCSVFLTLLLIGNALDSSPPHSIFHAQPCHSVVSSTLPHYCINVLCNLQQDFLVLLTTMYLYTHLFSPVFSPFFIKFLSEDLFVDHIYGHCKNISCSSYNFINKKKLSTSHQQIKSEQRSPRWQLDC